MSEKAKAVGPLEMEVLGLFDQEPLTVAQVHKLLESRGKDLAYTTVMTVLTRLHEKKYLKRYKEGKQYLYSSPIPGGVGQTVLEKVRRALFQNQRLKPILNLLNSGDGLSKDELLELKKVIDEKIKHGAKK